MTSLVSIPGEDQVLKSLSVTRRKVVDVEGDLSMSYPRSRRLRIQPTGLRRKLPTRAAHAG